MVIGTICGFLFILIQLILLVDFAHRFVEYERRMLQSRYLLVVF